MTAKSIHKWHQSVFSLLIAMAMIFSMLPVSAFASDDVQDTIVFGDPVATPASTGGLLLTDGSEDDPDALLTCDCESRCTEEAINTDCPVCATQPELCVVGVVAPEIQAAAIMNNLTFMSGSNTSGEGYAWNGTDKTLTLTGFTLSYSGTYASVAVPDGTTVILEGSSMIFNNGAGHGLSAGSNGDLTIQGTGSLMITTTGAGNAIYCGSFTMEDGSVSASTTNSDFGVRVGPDGVFSVTGGTLTAIGGTDRAISKNYTVPAGDSYWVSSTTTPNGIELIGDGSTTVINYAYKYAKIVAVGSINYTLVYNNLTNTLHKNNSGGDEVTDLTGWVGNGLTLTLNDGFEFETSAATALVMPIGATLQVNGNAAITSTNTNTTANCVGIEAVGAPTIDVAAGKTLTVNTSDGGNSNTGITCAGITKSGDGKLNVTAGSATNQSYGIVVIGGNFTMTAGTIIAVTNGGALYDSNAILVWGNISTGDFPIKGYDGSAYTIDASFQDFVPPTRSVPTIKTIQDSRGLAVYNAKLGTEPPEPEPPAPPAPAPSSGGSSRSRGSNKNDKPAPAAPVIAPMDDKSSGTLSNAIDAATSGSGTSFGVILRNVSNFTQENAAAVLKKAKALGKKATVSSDTMSEDGMYVEVRVTLDPALIKQTVRLDGYTRQAQIFITQSKFTKHFSNKTAVINLAQEGKFGQTAKISAKLDLSGFDTDNLYLYSYDKKANQYTLITSKDYKIDANGYLVFHTDFGGDIIVSNGRLVKKS